MGNKRNHTERNAGVDFIHSQELRSEEEAIQLFGHSAERLNSIAQWQQFMGATDVAFSLADERGNELQRPAYKGDYVKVDLSRLASAGRRYAWVYVEALRYTYDPSADAESLVLQLRSSGAPGNQTEEAIRFFDPAAAGTFILSRKNRKVSIEYFSRFDPHALTDNMPHMVANLGNSLGFSDLQWHDLLRNIIRGE